MASIAISTWALHRRLTEDRLPLLDLPAEVRERGYDAIELCHFHLPSTDPAYLDEFRESLSASGVRLQSLLIDDGDLSDAERSAEWESWISGQVEIAGRLGAERGRVIAGKQVYTEENFERSKAALQRLADQAIGVGVRLTTENWFPLLSTPEHVNAMLDALDGKLGLCGDFGNWPSPMKFEGLPQILERAETMHAKCEFVNGIEIDRVDYDHCLRISRDAGFAGTYVFVNGGPAGGQVAEEWHAIDATRDALLDFLNGA
jgi:sugar phosphate isomerase/epimerase